MTDTPDTEPVALGEPLEPMSEADIIRYARGVITQEYLLADTLNDRDWNSSLMLLICAWNPMPPNASCLFLVPLAPHQNGRWLNGRVPALTMKATCVPVESTEALVMKCREFYELLHPEEATADDGPG